MTSFKIEGRLKNKAYVMNVVGHYRKQLDALLEARTLRPAASGVVHLDFEPDPQRTFNRGFTEWFLHGRARGMASPLTPKMIGGISRSRIRCTVSACAAGPKPGASK